MKPFQEQTYYELLEVSPEASAEEIRTAYQRASELYGEDSMVLYSLADPDQAKELRRLLTEAFEYLSDPDLRGEYDRSIGLEAVVRSNPEPKPPLEAEEPPASHQGQQQSVPPEETEALPPSLLSGRQPSGADPSALQSEAGPVVVRTPVRPKSSEISDAQVNGELLRQVRKANGMSIQLLAERTKISVRHLENVEADRYEALPATVYLRGILMSVARELGLDPLRIAKGYLALVVKSR